MDLERVDKITTGAVGEPGERTFFLQARQGERTVTNALITVTFVSVTHEPQPCVVSPGARFVVGQRMR